MMINNMSNVINDATKITHTTRTLLDPIAVTNQLNIYNAGVYNTPPYISDHFATYLYMNMDLQPSTSTKRRVWNYKRADFNKLNSLITNVDWSFISHGSLDEACELFTSKFIELAKTCIPNNFVIVRPNDKPWYTSDIMFASRQRDTLHDMAKTSTNVVDWNNYKKARKKINNMKKHAKLLLLNNLEFSLNDLSVNNPRQYWKMVKLLVKGNASQYNQIPPLKNSDQSFSLTDLDNANTLNNYFTSIDNVDDSSSELPDRVFRTNNRLDNFVISEQEITDVLSNLLPNKATGPDEISHRMLKSTTTTLCVPLCLLFNRSSPKPLKAGVPQG